MIRRQFLKTGAAIAGAAAISRPLAGARPGGGSRFEWSVYGGDQEATRYCPLSEIDRSNVNRLEVAWVHNTGDAMERPRTTIECTPIVVNGVMYITTAQVQTRALDAATGKILWNFDPFEGKRMARSKGVNRGVTYWQDPLNPRDKRIFVTVLHELYCLDADSGDLVRSFGEGGVLDLTREFDHPMEGLMFKHTSPPVVWNDFLIVGGGGGEGPRPAAPGHVRGYDARNGRRRWIFHTIPRPGQLGHETWKPSGAWKTAGGANCWGGMSVDEKRGWVFAGIGSPAFDFYGGDRIGENLFGNCVLALNAETGERIWHYQTVHHDLWDYDLPCQPMLVTVNHDGRPVDAVAQIGKTGWVYLLDRQSGEPLFPIAEKPVPASDVPGEQAWPTQPMPHRPPAFARQAFFEDDVTRRTPEAYKAVLELYQKSRAGRIFTPPARRPTVIMPGFHGGGLWGAGAFDPQNGKLYVNSNEIPWILELVNAKPDAGYPYEHTGYRRFEDPDGYPAIQPPWGRLNALDLHRGTLEWQVILGEYPELAAKGVSPTGTENIGGSIVTAGGLVFTAATKDEKFRAFNSESGEVLWETKLPAGGYATPCSYEAGGRQYVVIAAGGGGKNRTPSGDAFVAFALPA